MIEDEAVPDKAVQWALFRARPESYCKWSDQGCGRAVMRWNGWNWCLLHGTEEYVAALWGAIKDAQALKRSVA